MAGSVGSATTSRAWMYLGQLAYACSVRTTIRPPSRRTVPLTRILRLLIGSIASIPTWPSFSPASGSCSPGTASITTVRSSTASANPSGPVRADAHRSPSRPVAPISSIRCRPRNSAATAGISGRVLAEPSATARTPALR